MTQLQPLNLIDQALVALQSGDFVTARDRMSAYGNHHTRELKHYLIEGLAILAMADWTAARSLFQQATDVFPDQAQLWFNRGLAEENLNLPVEAEASYLKSLQLKQDQG